MKQAKILMVEDERSVCDFNRDYLEGQGYLVTEAHTLGEAAFMLEDVTPDLILLDVMLPDGLGWDFCQSLRGKTNAPVIFLSCRNENESVIRGLMQGGDDYIAKPYDLTVLGARIAAQLRRSGLDFAGRIELPPLSIDILTGTATLSGEVVPLSQKELQLLCCLVLSAGKRVSAKELYQRVWGGESEDYGNLVGTIVSRLRSRFRLDEGSPFELTSSRSGEREYLFRKVRFD